MAEHQPTRRARTLWLLPECSCGRMTLCRLPLWSPPDRIPDGDTVPWPTNQRPEWATERTQPLNTRPWLTRGQAYRAGGWRTGPAPRQRPGP